MIGQLDIFGSVAAVEPPTTSAPRIGAALAPDEIGYARSTAQRACDDCWRDQAAAFRDGAPFSPRKSAKWLRRTAADTLHLCTPHKIFRQEREAKR